MYCCFVFMDQEIHLEQAIAKNNLILEMKYAHQPGLVFFIVRYASMHNLG